MADCNLFSVTGIKLEFNVTGHIFTEIEHMLAARCYYIPNGFYAPVLLDIHALLLNQYMPRQVLNAHILRRIFDPSCVIIFSVIYIGI